MGGHQCSQRPHPCRPLLLNISLEPRNMHQRASTRSRPPKSFSIYGSQVLHTTRVSSSTPERLQYTYQTQCPSIEMPDKRSMPPISGAYGTSEPLPLVWRFSSQVSFHSANGIKNRFSSRVNKILWCIVIVIQHILLMGHYYRGEIKTCCGH
jgi:hypothetical protein